DQAQQTAAGFIGVQVGAVENNFLAVQEPGDRQVLELNGDLIARGDPTAAGCPGDDDATGARTQAVRCLAIIGDRYRMGIVDRIQGDHSIADQGTFDRILVTAVYFHTIAYGAVLAAAGHGRLALHDSIHIVEGRIGFGRDASLIIGLRLKLGLVSGTRGTATLLTSRK